MQKILNNDETESIFTMITGRNKIAVSTKPNTEDALPDSIKLQVRFRDSKDNQFTEWQDTKTVLSADNGWQVVIDASKEFQYKLIATAAGAVVVVSNIDSTKFQ